MYVFPKCLDSLPRPWWATDRHSICGLANASESKSPNTNAFARIVLITAAAGTLSFGEYVQRYLEWVSDLP